MNLAGIVHAAVITNCCYFQGWNKSQNFKSTFGLCGQCVITQAITTQKVFGEMSQDKRSTVCAHNEEVLRQESSVPILTVMVTVQGRGKV